MEKLEQGTLSKGDIIYEFKNASPKEELLGYFGMAFEEMHIFKKRKQILLDATEAHFNGTYTLSIPAFFAQLEGLLRELGGLNLSDKFKPTVNTDIWDKRLLFSISDNSKHFNAFISKLYQGSQSAESFNRNPILHGMNVDYYSEEHSLILMLTILEIRTFKWFEEKTEGLITIEHI